MAFVVVESGFRIHHALRFIDLSDIDTGERNPVVQPDREMPMRDIMQISGNPRIIYELIPSSTYLFQSVKVVTSDQGFRDRSYPAEKPANTQDKPSNLQ
jgi:hypothetical protein